MNNKCMYSPWLSILIDGELSHADEEKLRSHLETCGECQKELGGLQRADSFLSDLAEIDPSPGFSQSFWNKVAQIEAKKEKWSLFKLLFSGWRPYVATATAVIIALFLILHRQPASFKIEEIFIAEQLELFENFEMIDELDLLENLDVIASLNETPS